MSDYFADTAMELLDFPKGQFTSGYVGRGRRHEGLAADVLHARWASAFRRWSDDRSFERHVALDDLCAELCLRGLPLPTDLVPDEWQEMRDELEGSDPEAFWEQ
ncbi:hypothetical protein [Methylobacterium mesophilicum]|uniref:hypothetical protein n=1 Tax=Methylobacterium mesophilicum TaxID=39956 RepID=UPI002F2E697D